MMYASSQGIGSSYECKQKMLALKFSAIKYVYIRSEFPKSAFSLPLDISYLLHVIFLSRLETSL